MAEQLWSNARVFRISDDQRSAMLGIDDQGVIPDAGLAIDEWGLDSTVWPFEIFGIHVDPDSRNSDDPMSDLRVLYLPLMRQMPMWEKVGGRSEHVGVIILDRGGGIANFTATYSRDLNSIDWDASLWHKEEHLDEGAEDLLTALFTMTTFFRLGVVLSDVLTHAASTVVAIPEVSRQVRRAALRTGRAIERSAYTISLRAGTTIERAAEDAAKGLNRKPGFPKRRHRVREHLRQKQGRIEVVRSHLRGGKASPGPDYLIRAGLIQ
jgi:hypothetical protein